MPVALRLAIRTLANAPQFSAVALIVLALGLGANAAIFSVVNSVLLQPLPFRDADRLVLLSTVGVTAADPLTLAAADVFVSAVACAACYIPARRAMRLDPTVVLRR
jgi:hypothetical protein